MALHLPLNTVADLYIEKEDHIPLVKVGVELPKHLSVFTTEPAIFIRRLSVFGRAG